MKILKIVGIVSLIILYVLAIFFFFKKYMILESKVFYITMLALTFILLVIYGIFYIVNRFNFEASSEPVHEFSNIYKQINKILNEMPTAEEFKWDMGNTTRVDTRMYNKKEYFGIIGNGNVTDKRMLVIGEIINNKFVVKKYVGDPTPQMEQDIFKDFQPVHKDTYSVWQRYLSKTDRRRQQINPFYQPPPQDDFLEPPEQPVQNEQSN